MADFCIQIAGHTAAVSSLFESTREYCRAYLTEEAPEFSIAVAREDLVYEQEMSMEEARQEGFRIRIFPDPFLERASIQRKMAEFLFDFDILMLHGSVVAVDGEGYLFAARSGTGKSTHTRLWRQAFGDRAVMVNDDKPFLKIGEGGSLVCGSPWSGKHGLDANVCVPLRGICVLERGRENRIRRAEMEEVVPMLIHQGYCPEGAARKARYEELARYLAEQTALWKMECNKDIQAAFVAQEAMAKPAER